MTSVMTSPASPKPTKASSASKAPPEAAAKEVQVENEVSQVESSSASADSDQELLNLFDGVIAKLKTSEKCLIEFGSEEFLDRILTFIESNMDSPNIVIK